MSTIIKQDNDLQDILCDLRQDAKLLQLAICGSESSMDSLTQECLLRLTDYLQQHVNDVCFLCKHISPKAKEHSIA